MAKSDVPIMPIAPDGRLVPCWEPAWLIHDLLTESPQQFASLLHHTRNRYPFTLPGGKVTTLLVGYPSYQHVELFLKTMHPRIRHRRIRRPIRGSYERTRKVMFWYVWHGELVERFVQSSGMELPETVMSVI